MIEPRKLNQKSDRNIWRIDDSLDVIYEKSKDLGVKRCQEYSVVSYDFIQAVSCQSSANK